ncbi:hypothetical protein CHH83_02215 [Bacillus sp. 7586-K]|nr:hypothetical protein CHH83_02215 [Bacillus sp. 7586-K]
MKPFDTDENVYYELFVYNAEELAEGFGKPIKAGHFYKDTLPSLDKINDSVKKAGYDTFEIERTVTEVERYLVK